MWREASCIDETRRRVCETIRADLISGGTDTTIHSLLCCVSPFLLSTTTMNANIKQSSFDKLSSIGRHAPL